jgi:hypothetical protein
MFKNWKKGAAYKPLNTPGLDPAGALPAELAKRYYAQLVAKGPQPVHVFPAKRTGHSMEFRLALAAFICKSKPVYSLPQDRKILEERAAALGYPFIEVDPADWGMK